jgi:hypothetical protein
VGAVVLEVLELVGDPELEERQEGADGGDQQAA